MLPGRNDPCICGSGKKFKKCCAGKETNIYNKNSKINAVLELEKLYNQKNQWLDNELSGRTPDEIEYDKIIIDSLQTGNTIEDSIMIANYKYPHEALQYNNSNIEDIKDHYLYLLNHMNIKNKMIQIKKSNELCLGIAWYNDPKTFLSMKNNASDPEIWENSYEEWLANIIDFEKKLKKLNYNIIRINIDVDGFSNYCQKNNRKPDAQTRAEYVNYLLKNKSL